MADIGLEEAERRWGYDRPDFEPDGAEQKTNGQAEPLLTWFGDKPPDPPAWLIQGILPERQVAILAGQFSAGKTFVGVDMSVAVMTGEAFVNCEVVRRGAVLWLAAEGRGEVMSRLQAASEQRGCDPKVQLPFAVQCSAVPTLSDPDALQQLLRLVQEFKTGLAERFPGVELAMIVIDTLGSAAGFQDENNASETQRVLNLLRSVSDASTALVLVIDHFGKVVETGVRGSSAKGAAADAILAVLADKSIEGKIVNRRLVVEKLRQAPTGRVIPFTLVSAAADIWDTTGAVEWAPPTISEQAAATVKPAWGGNSRVLKSAIERAMIDFGVDVRPWGANQGSRKAVKHEQVRSEFYGSYPAENVATKRQAFNRMVKEALAKQLIGAREIAGTDWIWIAKEDQTTDANRDP